MTHSDSTNSPQDSSQPAASQPAWLAPLQQLKSKRISYLTLPLLVMATVVEFVILATGWKYQQVVCLPQGMGVTFFKIGPIGATILACELLKLPLAIWTASRQGWQKALMIMVGLPLICVLTFQLVKDMAVYEMGVAMTPASQALEKASAEELKIDQLKGQLTAIEQKKTDRERKVAELNAKQAKAKADLADALKRNDDARQDAVSLTDYQKKELSQVASRESDIIALFNSDTDQLNRSLNDLRARREAELARDSKWNTEEARIDNAYKAKLADYENKRAAYEKAKADYDKASYLRRKLMVEPVDPGVPPVRESNTNLKSSVLADLEAQIKAKEAELATVNAKRRDRVAQVEAEAQQMRQEFDKRSGTKREDVDKERAALMAAQAAQTKQWEADQKQSDQDLATAVQKVEGIRAELDAAQKRAEGYYEEREADIRKTQVHRIATTVEIVRGLIKGERPMSIKMSAKERGDILTDQISMVRIWVYPVLAFIVAFLPTLMVEIGFSTVFQPPAQRPAYRLGFFGRHLHWLYIRAGRHKILRAERLAGQASAEIAARDEALASERAAAEQALAEKEGELQATREALSAATAQHAEQLAKNEEERAAQLKAKEEEWVAKCSGMADSLNRTVVEKDALRDMQKSEVERQIQLRQNAWSDRLTALRRELDEQRAATDEERTTMMQEHQKKLFEVSEECRNQVVQARRQAANAELAAAEATGKLNQELREALHARETAEAQLKQQADSFALKLSQAKDDAAREMDKSARHDKHRLERQQLEFKTTMRQREEDFERQCKQREQEMNLALDARLTEERTRIEQEARRRETEIEHQLDARATEIDARWKQESQQSDEAAQVRLKQREQQLQAQADARLTEIQKQAKQELRRREVELEQQIETQAREADARLKQLSLEKEEQFLTKSRLRDQQWQAKLDAAQDEAKTRTEETIHRLEVEAAAARREWEAQLRREIQQKEQAAQTKALEREQELIAELTAQATARQMAAQAQWETESEKKTRAAIETFKSLLNRTQKERDEAIQSASEGTRHVQSLEKKLSEVSSFLNGWRNGKNRVPVDIEDKGGTNRG